MSSVWGRGGWEIKEKYWNMKSSNRDGQIIWSKAACVSIKQLLSALKHVLFVFVFSLVVFTHVFMTPPSLYYYYLFSPSPGHNQIELLKTNTTVTHSDISALFPSWILTPFKLEYLANFVGSAEQFDNVAAGTSGHLCRWVLTCFDSSSVTQELSSYLSCKHAFKQSTWSASCHCR